MRPLKVPRMRRKDLLQRLAEDRKLSMEAGSLYGSYYMDVTKSDGTLEKRVRPGVCSLEEISLNFTLKIVLLIIYFIKRDK